MGEGGGTHLQKTVIFQHGKVRRQACARAKNGRERGKIVAESEKKRVGRPQKYTKKTLEKAVLRYFDSITYDAIARDATGQAIKNKLGEPIMLECYAKPPSKMDLCLFLGIDRGTWLNYCNHDEHPEFKAITDYVHLRCEAYLAGELVVRERGVDGIKFNLANNYGWSAKREIEVGEKTRKALSVDSMSMAEKMTMLKSALADLGEGGFAEGFDDEAENEDEE